MEYLFRGDSRCFLNSLFRFMNTWRFSSFLLFCFSSSILAGAQYLRLCDFAVPRANCRLSYFIFDRGWEGGREDWREGTTYIASPPCLPHKGSQGLALGLCVWLHMQAACCRSHHSALRASPPQMDDSLPFMCYSMGDIIHYNFWQLLKWVMLTSL